MTSTEVLAGPEDEGRGRTFPCEQCGADLVFHIGAQSLRCEFCGFTKDLTTGANAVGERDLVAQLRALSEKRHTEDTVVATDVHCDACGADNLFDGTVTTKECAYCGAPLQRRDVHDSKKSRLEVDAVLTFLVERQRAQENLRRWVRSRWFAPNEFKRRGVDGKLNGVYLPFYTFDSMTAVEYRGERGTHYTVTVGSGNNRRTETRTRWTPASGSFQRFFDDVLVPAIKSLPKSLLIALEPWPLDKARPFVREALAGSTAHTYDVDLEQGLGIAKERIQEALEVDVRQRIGGDAQRIDELRTAYSAWTFKHVLLPVWLLAYRYHDKSYRVAINACTGEVVGERPYSWIKIALAVIAGAIAALALLSTDN